MVTPTTMHGWGQAANETASCKIIGLTLETRPDCIDAEELRRLRRYAP